MVATCGCYIAALVDDGAYAAWKWRHGNGQNQTKIDGIMNGVPTARYGIKYAPY